MEVSLLGFGVPGPWEILIVIVLGAILFGRPLYHRWSWIYFSLRGDTSKALRAEERVGAALARSVREEMPPDPQSSRRRFVCGVADRLIAQGEQGGYSFRFDVLRDEQPNAMALPGGYVFVTVPLVKLCHGASDEMAFVLAHEMAHISKAHAKHRMVDGFVLSLLIGLLAGNGWLGRLFRKWTLRLSTSAYAQDQEYEADAIAIEHMKRSGFDVDGGPRILEKLQSAHRNSLTVEYFSTHPSIAERVKRIRKRLSVY